MKQVLLATALLLPVPAMAADKADLVDQIVVLVDLHQPDAGLDAEKMLQLSEGELSFMFEGLKCDADSKPEVKMVVGEFRLTVVDGIIFTYFLSCATESK
jgi:hypothetical protein